MRQFKYIVYQKNHETFISCGYVEFHRQLKPSSHNIFGSVDSYNVLGGGKFRIDEDNKQIVFYGSSDDFGSVDKKLLKRILDDNCISICDDIWYAIKHEFMCTHDRSTYQINEYGEITSLDWKYENETFNDYKLIIE